MDLATPFELPKVIAIPFAGKIDVGDEFADLLAKIALGDRSAFALLYKRSCAKLYGIAQQILRRQQLASDALQEVYVKIWRNAAKFDRRMGEAMSWMAVLARRHAVDMARRSRYLFSEDDLIDEHPTEALDPLTTRDRHESLRALLLCLSRLDPRKRELIMHAYYRGASREELSLRLNIPVPTIKTQLRRALAELKTSLMASGGARV